MLYASILVHDQPLIGINHALNKTLMCMHCILLLLILLFYVYESYNCIIQDANLEVLFKQYRH